MPGWPAMTTAFTFDGRDDTSFSAIFYSALIKMSPPVKEAGNPRSTSNVCGTSTSSRELASRWTFTWQIGFSPATQRLCQNAMTPDDNYISLRVSSCRYWILNESEYRHSSTGSPRRLRFVGCSSTVLISDCTPCGWVGDDWNFAYLFSRAHLNLSFKGITRKGV